MVKIMELILWLPKHPTQEVIPVHSCGYPNAHNEVLFQAEGARVCGIHKWVEPVALSLLRLHLVCCEVLFTVHNGAVNPAVKW